MSDIPQAAIDAAYAAYQKAWLTRNQDNPMFAENVVRDVLEAAAPHLAVAERRRICQLLLQDPVVLTDPVAIARLLKASGP